MSKRKPVNLHTTIRVPRDLARKMKTVAEAERWRVELTWRLAAEQWLAERDRHGSAQ